MTLFVRASTFFYGYVSLKGIKKNRMTPVKIVFGVLDNADKQDELTRFYKNHH